MLRYSGTKNLRRNFLYKNLNNSRDGMCWFAKLTSRSFNSRPLPWSSRDRTVTGRSLSTTVHGLTSVTVHRSPFTIQRSSFTVHRSPSTVQRSAFTAHLHRFTNIFGIILFIYLNGERGTVNGERWTQSRYGHGSGRELKDLLYPGWA